MTIQRQNTWCFLVLLMFFSNLPMALGGVGGIRQAKAHRHGSGALSAVLDASNLQVELEVPLADLAGFEHAPTSSDEHAKLAEVLKAETYEKAVVPNPEAKCQITMVVVEQNAVGESHSGHHTKDEHMAGHKHHHSHQHSHQHGHPGKQLAGDAQPVDKHEAHQDLRVKIQFKCEQPEQLHSLDAQILTRTPHALSLQGRFMARQKQGYQLLTSQAAVLKL